MAIEDGDDIERVNEEEKDIEGQNENNEDKEEVISHHHLTEHTYNSTKYGIDFSDPSFLSTNGFTFVRPSDQMIQYAYELMNEVEGLYPDRMDMDHYDNISGGYYQTIIDLQNLKSAQKYLHHLTEALRTVFERRGKDVQGYNLHSLKLLIAPPGSGSQALHRDCDLKNEFVVAFYMTPHRTTQFSKFYVKEHLDIYYQYLMSVEAKENQTQDELYGYTQCQQILTEGWDVNNLYAFKVNRPFVGIFCADAIHQGPVNDSEMDRKVIFSVFCEGEYTDKYQVFEWVTVANAYGTNSKEYREAILKWRDYKPENHEMTEEGKRRIKHILS